MSTSRATAAPLHPRSHSPSGPRSRSLCEGIEGTVKPPTELPCACHVLPESSTRAVLPSSPRASGMPARFTGALRASRVLAQLASPARFGVDSFSLCDCPASAQPTLRLMRAGASRKAKFLGMKTFPCPLTVSRSLPRVAATHYSRLVDELLFLSHNVLFQRRRRRRFRRVASEAPLPVHPLPSPLLPTTASSTSGSLTFPTSPSVTLGRG